MQTVMTSLTLQLYYLPFKQSKIAFIFLRLPRKGDFKRSLIQRKKQKRLVLFLPNVFSLTKIKILHIGMYSKNYVQGTDVYFFEMQDKTKIKVIRLRSHKP